MYDGVKGQFVKALGDGVDPRTIPAHFVVYYDDAVRMFAKFGHYSGVEDVPANYWPLICLMAELKMRVEKLEKAAKPSLSLCVAEGEPDATVHKIDLRTKEGRALRQVQTVGA